MATTQENHIYFLVKDPHWTFLWWELTQETLQCYAVQNDNTTNQLILRISDVTHIIYDGKNAHSWFDVEVRIKTNHWYLYIGESNRNYVAEIGFRKPDGLYIPYARSHSIYLPRDRACEYTKYNDSTISM